MAAITNKKYDTIYISDLDGTLLDTNAMLSPESAEMINKAISNGANFTIATARTMATVKYLLKDLNINLPVILMNGVMIYNLANEHIQFSAVLEKTIVEKIIKTLRIHKLNPYMYTIENDIMHTYYEEITTPSMQEFYDDRAGTYHKPFTKTDDFLEVTDDVIYFSIVDTFENLKPLSDDLAKIDDIIVAFYKDNYSPDYWYLEIFSKEASKKNAVKRIRQSLKPEKIVCFGDNFNDLPMFEEADYSIAVGNALDEVKNSADEIIGVNSDHSVAKYVLERTI